MIKKYRKKPIIIEAWKWNETQAMLDEIGCKAMSCTGEVNNPDYVGDLRIETLRGTVGVRKGDYIIKGVKGEFYPCKPNIFQATYEPVKDDAEV